MWQLLSVAGIVALLVVLMALIDFYRVAEAAPQRGFFWQTAGMIAAVVVLVVLLATIVKARVAVGRVQRVLKAFEEMRQGKYPRLLVEGDDELAELTRGFNQLVEEIRSRDEKLKSWMGHRETEVVRLAKTLETERERLGTVLDSIGDGVIVLDSDGQVLMANRRVSEIFGVPLDMLQRTNLSNLIDQIRHRLVRPEVVEEKVKELMKNPALVDEIVLELDEPGGLAVRLYCAPVRGADGKVLGRIATSLDLGRERELDRLKTEFLSTISHELRTPLTSVKGALGLIRGGAAGPISSDVRELLEIALSNTDRLIRVITDILDIFQLERGQARMRPAPVALAASMARSIQTLADAAGMRKVTIEVQIPKNLPTVLADARRIEQVLVNLLSNAIKFSPLEGKVIVSARAQTEKVVVSVQDFGRGMKREFLERLFRKFEHEQGALTRESQGAGLGLAICRHIVQQHDGVIWAESEEGVGSTFSFTLPFASAAAVADHETHGAGAMVLPEPRLILVIDDDQDVARIISYVFESQGHRVITVHHGRDAITMARRHHPDMLTLDLNMPDIDGYMVLNELRGDDQTRGIPIICISVEGDPSRALAEGANYFLEKPLDIDKLRDVAGRVLAAV
jgi:signal transduction histidine kinase/CheY-like chemotaxis protein